MRKTLGLVLSLSISSVMASSDWTYTGEHGADNWAKINPAYSACAGKSQSPVNLSNFTEADLADLAFNYQAGANTFEHKGHTTRVTYQAGSSIQVDGKTFELKQFHFHAPSENHIEGKPFPMEMHLVHTNPDGSAAVVALMFTPGPQNAFIDKLWAQMPEKTRDKSSLKPPLNVMDLLPLNRDYYRFEGSLTTPPCREGLHWLVLKNPAPITKAQWQFFAKTIGYPNNRPIQDLNGRQVLQ